MRIGQSVLSSYWNERLLIYVCKGTERKISAVDSCCRHNLKFNFENSRRRLADYVKKLHQKACRRIIFPSFNQSYHLASENTKRQYSRVYKKLTRRYIGVAVGS